MLACIRADGRSLEPVDAVNNENEGVGGVPSGCRTLEDFGIRSLFKISSARRTPTTAKLAARSFNHARRPKFIA